MLIYTYSNERWELSRLLGLAAPLAALYGQRWRRIRPDWTYLCGRFAPPLPGLRPWASQLSLQRAFVIANDHGPEAARCIIELASPLFTERCSTTVVWAAPNDVPREQDWGSVSAEADERGLVVGVDLKQRLNWAPAVLLPAIIEAGALPLEYGEADGRPTVRHRIDDGLLMTPHRKQVEAARWDCLLPGETLQAAIARAERIVEAIADGPVRTFWLFDAPETTEAADGPRLALWERLVEIQPPASDYGVRWRFHVREVEVLEALRVLGGKWDLDYWFGSVNLRDEQGNPVGFEEDDGVALFINVGVETSPAGHRLVLESDYTFNRDPITRVTGLTFTEWEV